MGKSSSGTYDCNEETTVVDHKLKSWVLTDKARLDAENIVPYVSDIRTSLSLLTTVLDKSSQVSVGGLHRRRMLINRRVFRPLLLAGVVWLNNEGPDTRESRRLS